MPGAKSRLPAQLRARHCRSPCQTTPLKTASAFSRLCRARRAWPDAALPALSSMPGSSGAGGAHIPSQGRAVHMQTWDPIAVADASAPSLLWDTQHCRRMAAPTHPSNASAPRTSRHGHARVRPQDLRDGKVVAFAACGGCWSSFGHATAFAREHLRAAHNQALRQLARVHTASMLGSWV